MARFVTVEEEATPLAVVFGEGLLAKKLAECLREERLRVVRLSAKSEGLPFWEKPAYVFFVASPGDNFSGFELVWKDLTGKKIAVLVNIDGQEQTLLPADGVVKIFGEEKGDENWLDDCAKKIVKFAFSGSKRMSIMGRTTVAIGQKARPLRGLDEVLGNSRQHAPVIIKKSAWLGMTFLLVAILLTVPFFWLGYSTIAGTSSVLEAAEALRKNEAVKVAQKSEEAKNHFASAKKTLGFTAAIFPFFGGKEFVQRYYNFVSAGERASSLVGRAGGVMGRLQEIIEGMLSDKNSGDLATEIKGIQVELSPIDQDLGFIEAQFDQMMTPRIVNLLSFFGVSRIKIDGAREKIAAGRKGVLQMGQLISSFEEIVPIKSGQSKTYLVVLQNSAELRPTGGFIGSYALVNFQDGKFTGYKIYDIYSADGQLRGHIAPPDEILHFLGQPSWYMRDANWAADWPLTAKRLEWFLEKETGVTVQGVVALNLGAVQKILKATGPLTLSDKQETVTAENLFDRAEFASEINFFAGSTQKPQFLASVAQAIFAKVTGQHDLDWTILGRELQQAVLEKEIMIYLDSPTAFRAVRENGWTGSIATDQCDTKSKNCLMLVEANLGANKANYFIRRNIRIDSQIDKAGETETTIILKYRNESPSSSWPGGDYKNYLRFLVPLGTKLVSFDLRDGREASLSSVLTAETLGSITENHFFVFESEEQAVGRDDKVKPVFKSYGAFFNVPVQTVRTIKFKYKPPYKLDFGKMTQDFQLVILKQPGTNSDTVDFALDYPSFLAPVWDSSNHISVLALPQKLVYNMELSSDRKIEVKFTRQ